jgi:hypothetical protein
MIRGYKPGSLPGGISAGGYARLIDVRTVDGSQWQRRFVFKRGDHVVRAPASDEDDITIALNDLAEAGWSVVSSDIEARALVGSLGFAETAFAVQTAYLLHKPS